MSQIKKKFLGADSVDGSKLKLANNEALRSRNAANSADIEIIKLNGSDKPEFLLVPSLPSDASAAGDAVRKSQFDTGLSAKLDASLKGAVNGIAELDAGGKVPAAQLPSSVTGAVSYQGTWDASTNSPALADATGTKGHYYVVSVAGSTSLDGESDWKLGDWAIFNGSAWEKVDNTDSVTSVNSQTGTVVLDSDDISEGATNQYFTESRAKAAAVADSITDGVLDVAPSQNAVFDALALKADASAVSTPTKENKTLTGTDITNQYVDLTYLAIAESMNLSVDGVMQYEGLDYSLSAVGGVTRISFLGDLATAGAAPLVAGDIIRVQYLR